MEKPQNEKRRATQFKLPHEGKKCLRGKGVFYDEAKQPLKLSLTPTAIAWLESIAFVEKCSMSEVIERAARGELASSVSLDAVS